MKWLKFGFTRTWDNLSLEIRNGRLTRDEAIEVLRERQDETPREDIEAFCHWAGITEDRFFEIAETFRNPDVWTRRDGTWMIDDFLIPDWRWALMCGIAGHAGPTPVPPERIERTLRLMHHRGPDSGAHRSFTTDAGAHGRPAASRG